MADNTVNRLGQINNTGLSDALFLKVFGEVLAAFRRTTQFMDKHYVRTIANGKSAQFPLIGRAGANYHTPGQEITGAAIPQNEKIITIDGVLKSDVSIAEIDEAMNHYEVRREFTAALGEALAQEFDRNVARSAIIAARTAGWHASMPGGTSVVAATAKTDSDVLVQSIFNAGVALDENFVPESDRYCFLKPLQYAMAVQNKTLLYKDYGGSANISTGEVKMVDSIQIVKSTNLPVTSVTGTYQNKYNVNASNVAALVMHRTAVGTCKLLDVKLDAEWSLRRLSTLMVARMAVGHGVLRPEAAVEIVTAAS